MRDSRRVIEALNSWIGASERRELAIIWVEGVYRCTLIDLDAAIVRQAHGSTPILAIKHALGASALVRGLPESSI